MKIGLVLTVLTAATLGLTALSSAQTRGMQTAQPRDSLQTRSPSSIDFTNPNGGTPVEKGTRNIPLQNLPFGERPREKFEKLWAQAEREGKNLENSNKGMWPKFKNPFKRDTAEAQPFRFPSNMNRKPNYSNGQVLTDRKPGFQLPQLFKPNGFEKPKWITDMNQKTKDMFNFNKNQAQNQANGFGQMAQQTSEDWRSKSNQAWQNFSNKLNPKSWNRDNGQGNSVSPPLRQANNWQDTLNQKRR